MKSMSTNFGRNNVQTLCYIALFGFLLIIFHSMAGQVTSGAADYYTDDDSISTHRNEILAIRTTSTSSATENGTLVSTAREIASAWESYPERTSDNPFDVSSTTITNNVPWKDNNGRILETGRGGKISRFDGYWWWVGSQPAKVWNDGGDIYLYKSKSLGSNSWEFVRKIYEFPENITSSTCQIHKHPRTSQIFVHCNCRKIIMSDDGIGGEFKLFKMSDDPTGLRKTGWNWGSGTVFQDEKDMYMAVSWCDKSKGFCVASTRKGIIYKLNSAWTDFDETEPVIAEFSWPHREAFDLSKRGKLYYLAASETQRWRQSRAWYKISRTIKGLQYAKENQMVMHLSNGNNVLSMGTQFRTLMKVGKGKWLFGGSRHPDEDPNNFDPKHGRFIFVPVKFIQGVPHVFWKNSFDWDTFSYESPEYDSYGIVKGISSSK